MAIEIARLGLNVVGLYLTVGLVFAPVFLLRGVHRIDSSARDGTKGFRVLVFPGVVALWPLLALRWRSGAGDPPEERGAHRQCAQRAGAAK